MMFDQIAYDVVNSTHKKLNNCFELSNEMHDAVLYQNIDTNHSLTYNELQDSYADLDHIEKEKYD
jgi:hypothetical protein